MKCEIIKMKLPFNIMTINLIFIGALCTPAFPALAKNTTMEKPMNNQDLYSKRQHLFVTLKGSRGLDFIVDESKMAVDSMGNAYVTGSPRVNDEGYAFNLLHKISPSGNVSPIDLDISNRIVNIAIDRKDNIYLSEYTPSYGGSRSGDPFPWLSLLFRTDSYFNIHKISAQGEKSRFFGKSKKDSFYNFTVDDNGIIYTSSYGRVKKITTKLFLTTNKTIIDYKAPPYSTDPYNSQFSASIFVVDRESNLYYVERFSPKRIEESNGTSQRSDIKPYDVIKKITPRGDITLIAGSDQSIGSVDGAGDQAGLESISSLCIDDKGNFYALESKNKTIRKINSSGIVTTLFTDVDALSISIHETNLYILKKTGVDIVRNLYGV